MFYSTIFEDFLIEKSFIPKIHFFVYIMDVSRNEESHVSVTTSLFMALLMPYYFLCVQFVMISGHPKPQFQRPKSISSRDRLLNLKIFCRIH